MCQLWWTLAKCMSLLSWQIPDLICAYMCVFVYTVIIMFRCDQEQKRLNSIVLSACTFGDKHTCCATPVRYIKLVNNCLISCILGFSQQSIASNTLMMHTLSYSWTHQGAQNVCACEYPSFMLFFMCSVYTLSFKGLGSVRFFVFLKEVSYARKGFIYLLFF